MKNIVLVAAIISLSQMAHAIDVVIAKETINTNNFNSELEYPVLGFGSVDGYSVINKQVRSLASEGCSAEDAIDASNSFYQEATTKLLTLNQNYVSYETSASEYCGGAHPNHYTVIATYDAKTGEALDMNKEVPRQSWEGENVDWKDRAAFEKDIAALIAYNSDVTADENGCFEGSQAEIIEQISSHSPTIAGLAADKKVILKTSPSHAQTACALSLEVPYELVQIYIKADSKIHTWLK
jgi:hypothetical protein